MKKTDNMKNTKKMMEQEIRILKENIEEYKAMQELRNNKVITNKKHKK